MRQFEIEECGTALLSQEGSVIAKQSREGWFPCGYVSVWEPPQPRGARLFRQTFKLPHYLRGRLISSRR